MSRRLLPFLFIVLLAAACAPADDADQPYPDWRFGVVESYEDPDSAGDLGAAWTRVRFHWGDVQPTGPDDWQPPLSDEQLQTEVEAGRQVVGLLIGIPAWARAPDQPPDGLWLPRDDPGNLWAAYVRAAVSRYAGRIDRWIIWNEPDIWDKAAPGHTWDGTVEDFAQMQRVSYLVAKEANPDAVVHLAAFTYFWDANYDREQYFSRLLSVMADDPEAAAHNYYFDVATAHLYFQPAHIYDIIVAFREIMDAHGLDHPLWLVETNAPPSADPEWPVPNFILSVTLEEQAAFIPQALAVALAAGAERVAIYKLQDIATDAAANPEPFGLLRMDGSERPAYDTFAVAAERLAGARSAARTRWDEIGAITLDQGRYTTTVLFSRLPSPQEAHVPAAGDRAFLVDMWGKSRRVRPEGDAYVVPLPPAPCTQSIGDYCMIGGEVYYLVQTNSDEALPRRLPPPHFSPTATPSPR